jgi:outer membrane protein
MQSKIYKIAVVSLLIITLVVVYFSWFNKPKTAYIIIQEVYSGFKMKLEMEKKFVQTTAARQKRLDSLQTELKSFATILDQNVKNTVSDLQKFDQLRDFFMQQKQMADQDNKNLMQQYDAEILTQLNQYVKDYGKEQHYQYIFGNDGNGSLMYGIDERNISKAVLEYINQKYEGKK